MGSCCLLGVSTDIILSIESSLQNLNLQKYKFSLILNKILWKRNHVYRKIFDRVITNFLYLAIKRSGLLKVFLVSVSLKLLFGTMAI